MVAIDLEDILELNKHSGFSVGYNSDEIYFDCFKCEIIKKIQKYLGIAKGVVIYFITSKQVDMIDIQNAMDLLQESIDSEADIIFGNTYSEDLQKDKCIVQIYLTGIERL